MVAIVLAVTVRTPRRNAAFKDTFAGEADHADVDVHARLGYVFKQIVTNPMVWIMAGAHACTGAVRQSIDQWLPPLLPGGSSSGDDRPKFQWLGFLIPFVASAGSLVTGWVSDRFSSRAALPWQPASISSKSASC